MKTKIISICSIFLIAIFSSPVIVSAGVYDSKVYTEWVYYPVLYEQLFYWDGNHTWAQLHHIYANGKLAYCIQPGVWVDENVYYSSSNNPLDAELSKENFDYYSKIAHYGYGYKDHNDEYWRMATQELIWRATGSLRNIYYSTDNTGYNVVNIDYYKNEIMRLVDAHDVVMSFDTEELIGYIGDTLILEDANEVLGLYDILEEDEDVVWKEDNKLYIKLTEVGNKQIKFEKKVSGNGENLIYFSPYGQNVITASKISPVEFLLDVEVLAKPEIPEMPKTNMFEIPVFKISIMLSASGILLMILSIIRNEKRS